MPYVYKYLPDKAHCNKGMAAVVVGPDWGTVAASHGCWAALV